MGKSLLRPAIALLLLGMSPAALHAQETASNAGVSGEADFNMYCASCHGEDGKGNGPKAFGLSKPVPDLTNLNKRYGKFPREKLEMVIDGRDPIASHMDREMPVWGVWFKEEAAAELGGAEGDEASVKRRVDNLIGHIESLQAPQADSGRLQEAAQAAARMASPRSDPMTPGNDIPPVDPGSKPGPVF